MDTPPDFSEECREGTEDYTTDIEQNLEAQIAELEQSLETQVARWADEWKQDAVQLDLKLRQAFAELREWVDEVAEERRSFEAAGYPMSDEAREMLRQMRQKMLDMGLTREFPPRWSEWVNALPAFAGLDGDKERSSRRAQQRKSPGAQQRKAKAAQRRKRRR